MPHALGAIRTPVQERPKQEGNMNAREEKIVSMLGEQVKVTNPNHVETSWAGKLIGYRDHPCVTLEFDDGSRMCLPADWLDEGTEHV